MPRNPPNGPTDGIPAGGVDSYMSYGRSWSNASNTPFRLHKHWTHEGGISTPLIVRWPAAIREPGRITDEVGHIIDIMATLVDVSGATYPSVRNGEAITGMEGNIVTLQEIFCFQQSGIDSEGNVRGGFRFQGVRPKFIEKFIIVHLQRAEYQ